MFAYAVAVVVIMLYIIVNYGVKGEEQPIRLVREWVGSVDGWMGECVLCGCVCVCVRWVGGLMS